MDRLNTIWQTSTQHPVSPQAEKSGTISASEGNYAQQTTAWYKTLSNTFLLNTNNPISHE